MARTASLSLRGSRLALGKIVLGTGLCHGGRAIGRRVRLQQLRLAELVAFTAITNLKSRAAMERLGMRLDSEFDHPQVPVESGLRRHVLYRLRSPG